MSTMTTSPVLSVVPQQSNRFPRKQFNPKGDRLDIARATLQLFRGWWPGANFHVARETLEEAQSFEVAGNLRDFERARIAADEAIHVAENAVLQYLARELRDAARKIGRIPNLDGKITQAIALQKFPDRVAAFQRMITAAEKILRDREAK